MSINSLNRRPRLAIALQLALLVMVFQGVVATTPSAPTGYELITVTRTDQAPQVGR